MNRAASALQFLSPIERETWLQIGMAIKSEFGDAGFQMWDEWSQSTDNYNKLSSRSVWKSYKGTGITIASLFHLAKQNGWKDNDQYAKPNREQMQARQRDMAERLTQEGIERVKSQQSAAKKAGWVMHQTKLEQHAYLHSKGWPDAKGPVWWASEESNLLCLPMRVGESLVGVQMIDREGGKRYLTGQRTSGAEYLISNNGRGASDFWVEGYATGLSLRECLHALRMRYRIHVTFSAGNLTAMANSGYVIADNDASGTGEKAAKKAGLPFFMPPGVGQDLNDMHKTMGTFKTSQILRKWLADVQKQV